jgi:ABC-2 type transport system ATP-binding protein
MLERLRQDGAALLLTTHQLDEAQQICDRIVIIDHGRAIANGTFEQLVRGTVGPSRRVTITLDTGERIESSVLDVGVELAAMLSRATAAGAAVAEVDIESPTLQAVFLHLTGRELRDA